MLNFYDTEAVKAFTLKILVENRELAALKGGSPNE